MKLQPHWWNLHDATPVKRYWDGKQPLRQTLYDALREFTEINIGCYPEISVTADLYVELCDEAGLLDMDSDKRLGGMNFPSWDGTVDIRVHVQPSREVGYVLVRQRTEEGDSLE